jgi:Ca2+-binding RTX toxin-like protein
MYNSIENLTGSAFDDTLIGDDGNNVLMGGDGRDALIGGAGIDTASYATSGHGVKASLADTRFNDGDAFGDTYDGIENLTGSAFDDTLIGDAGNNVLTGGAGNDALMDADMFGEGAGGNDTLIGGTGDDNYYVSSASTVIVEKAGEGTDTVFVSGLSSYTLADNIENGRVGFGTDTLIGNTLDNTLYAGFFGTTLDGGAGNDALWGNSGNDILIGGSGADTLVGDSNGDISSDTASYITALTGVTANLLAPSLNTGDAAGDVYVSIENLTGSNFNDTLTGDGGDNVLDGGAGNDVLMGAGGQDTYLFARGDGHDQIVNGIFGNSGASGELDFGPGINANQLWFQQTGNDLTISVMGSQDRATIADWYDSSISQLREITTSDGSKIDSDLAQLVQAMASYSASNPGFDPSSVANAPNDSNLQNTIAASWHH